MPDKTVAVNRRAHHQFAIEETLEAGLALTGTEIKSIRAGRVNLAEAYARIERGEAWLIGRTSPRMSRGNGTTTSRPGPESCPALRPDRRARWATQAKGFTLVPMKLYIRNGMAKLEIGIGAGEEGVRKRRTIAERDARRDLERSTKERSALARFRAHWNARATLLAQSVRGDVRFRQGSGTGNCRSRSPAWPRKTAGKPVTGKIVTPSPPK